MRRSRSPHVSHVTRADDEGNGPPEFMCHMWMRERPPPYRPLIFAVWCVQIRYGHCKTAPLKLLLLCNQASGISPRSPGL